MRYNLLEKLTTIQGIDIYKPTSIPWTEFEFSKGFRKYILTDDDIMKFYLVSYRFFNTIEYEDLLMLINGISDIFAILPGTEIKIPFLEDIEAFILKYKK